MGIVVCESAYVVVQKKCFQVTTNSHTKDINARFISQQQSLRLFQIHRHLHNVTQIYLPTTKVYLPTTQTYLTTTQVYLTTTQVYLPITKLYLPNTQVYLPTTQLNLPTTKVYLPTSCLNIVKYSKYDLIATNGFRQRFLLIFLKFTYFNKFLVLSGH